MNPVHALPIPLRFILVSASCLCLGLADVPLPSGIRVFLFSPCLPHAPPIIPTLIWSPSWRLVGITHQGASRCTVSSIFCYFLLLILKCLPEYPFHEHPLPLFPSFSVRDQVAHPQKTTELPWFNVARVPSDFLCFADSFAIAFRQPGLQRLVIFQVPNLTSVFRLVHRFQESLHHHCCLWRFVIYRRFGDEGLLAISVFVEN